MASKDTTVKQEEMTATSGTFYLKIVSDAPYGDIIPNSMIDFSLSGPTYTPSIKVGYSNGAYRSDIIEMRDYKFGNYTLNSSYTASYGFIFNASDDGKTYTINLTAVYGKDLTIDWNVETDFLFVGNMRVNFSCDIMVGKSYTSQSRFQTLNFTGMLPDGMRMIISAISSFVPVGGYITIKMPTQINWSTATGTESGYTSNIYSGGDIQISNWDGSSHASGMFEFSTGH